MTVTIVVVLLIVALLVLAFIAGEVASAVDELERIHRHLLRHDRKDD